MTSDIKATARTCRKPTDRERFPEPVPHRTLGYRRGGALPTPPLVPPVPETVDNRTYSTGGIILVPLGRRFAESNSELLPSISGPPT